MSTAHLQLIRPEQELLPQHQHKLFTSSGIDPEIVQERGYQSVTDDRLLSQSPYNFLPWVAGHVPALLIPIRNTTGKIVHYCMRPDEPVETHRASSAGRVTPKVAKYLTPSGSGTFLDVPPRVQQSGALDDPNRELWITESPLKADSAVSRGLDCVDIWGVWNWRWTSKQHGSKVLPDFENIAWFNKRTGLGRKVYLVFDSDTRTNLAVNMARARLINWLSTWKPRVYLVDLPVDEKGAKQGLDDYFVNGGTVQELRERAVAASDRISNVELDEYGTTELGHAARFAWLMGDLVRAVDGGREWLLWASTHWTSAVEEDLLTLSMFVPQYMREQAALLPDTPSENGADKRSPREKRYAAAKALETRSMLTNMVHLSRGISEMRVKPEDLDSEPWYLNAANGTIDLKTGKLLQPHQPAHLITNISEVSYEPDRRDERFERFLRVALGEDDEYEQRLQAALGAGLYGATTFEGFFFLKGPTSAGKSTLMDAVKSAVGTYARRADLKSFLVHGDGGVGDKPRPDLYRLVGSRYILAAEADEGAELAGALIKQLTGGSSEYLVRDLYSKANTYLPWRPSTILFSSNVYVKIDGIDDAAWRRVWTCPFNHSMLGHEDPSLKLYLRDPKGGAPAVLAWLVQGCLRWQEQGKQFIKPQAVKAADADYRTEMDRFFPWRDTIRTGDQYKATVAQLQASLHLWSEREGVILPHELKTSRGFGRWVRKVFPTIRREQEYADRGSTMLPGVGLVEEEVEAVNRRVVEISQWRKTGEFPK